jgi:hypothetical protein
MQNFPVRLDMRTKGQPPWLNRTRQRNKNYTQAQLNLPPQTVRYPHQLIASLNHLCVGTIGPLQQKQIDHFGRQFDIGCFD